MECAAFGWNPQKNFTRPPRENNQGLLVSFKFVLSGVHQLVSAGRGLAASAFERILNSLFLYTIQLLMYIFKNIICQWDKRSSVVGGIWSIKIFLSVGFTNWWAWEMDLGAMFFFFQGRIFGRKHGSYRNLFSGMGLFYIFPGFDHRVCYQNSKNEPFIYI